MMDKMIKREKKKEGNNENNKNLVEETNKVIMETQRFDER